MLSRTYRLSFYLTGFLLFTLTNPQSAKIKFIWDESVTGASFTSDATVAADIDEKLERAKRKIGGFARNLDIPDQDDFLTEFSNSHIHNITSMFALPGKHPKLFVVGADTGDTVVDTGAIFLGDFYSNYSGMIGLNPKPLGMPEMGFIDPGRLLFMAGFFKQTFREDSISGDIMHASLMSRYKLIPGDPDNFWKQWHGLNLTTGIIYSNAKLRYDPKLDGESKTEPEYVLTYRGPSLIGINSQTFTIPIELATDTSLLYILNISLGVGLDINLGQSTNVSDIGGNIRFEYRNTSQTKTIGKGKLVLDNNASPSYVLPRFFIGAMVNAVVVRVHARIGFSTDGNLSFHAGARALW